MSVERIPTGYSLLYAREQLRGLFSADSHYESSEDSADPEKTLELWQEGKETLLSVLPYTRVSVPAISVTDPLRKWGKAQGLGEWMLLSGEWPEEIFRKTLPCPPGHGDCEHPQGQAYPADVCYKLIYSRAIGRLVFSVLPADILGCSEKGHDFGETSCYAPGLQYASAPTALFPHPLVGIVTVRDDGDTLCGREWVYLRDDYLMFAEGRAYGTFCGSPGFRRSARVLVEHVLSSALRVDDSWVSVDGGAATADDPNHSMFGFFRCGALYTPDGIRSVTRHVSQRDSLRPIVISEARSVCLACGRKADNAQDSVFCSRCAEDDRPTCHSCGERLDNDYVYCFQDHDYCESCYNDTTSYCEWCDETVAADEVQSIRVYRRGRWQDMVMCDYCVRHNATACEHGNCDQYVADGEGIDVGDETWCPDCWESDSFCCVACDDCFDAEKAVAVWHKGDREPVCTDCAKEYPIVCDVCDTRYAGEPDDCPLCRVTNARRIPVLPGIEVATHDGA